MNITRKEQKGGTSEIGVVPANLAAGLGIAISQCIGRGAAVSVFRTRDGGAVGFRILWGTVNEVEYHRDWADVVRALEDVAAQLDGAVPEVPEPGMAKKRLKIATASPPKGE